MSQRKISNLIADELTATLESKGVEMGETEFESAVSNITAQIMESVNKISEVDEEIEVDSVFFAQTAVKVGDIDVQENEFIEVTEIDFENDVVVVNVYDEEGEARIEDAEVSFDELAKLEELDSIVAVEEAVLDAETVDESVLVIEAGKISFKGGKKHKISDKILKLKEKAKAKGSKYMVKNGKIVKKTTAQIKAQAKAGKRLKKFAGKGKALKNMLKARKANAGATSGTVAEGFDLLANGITVAIEAGDVLSIEEGVLTVTRGENVIISGVSVDENFMDTCISESVLETEKVEDANEAKKSTKVKEEDDVDTGDGEDDFDKGDGDDVKADEAVVLTFKSGSGYVLLKEGKEIPMGNRVRARAFLRNEGYEVSANDMDKASVGKLVTL